MMTRRHFLGAAAVVSVAGGLGAGGALLLRRHLEAAQIDAPTALALRGGVFRLQGYAGSLPARVAEVHTERKPARPGAPAVEQISICLAVDADAGPGLYRLQGDDLSLGELYYTPINRPGAERRLEAVITRIV